MHADDVRPDVLPKVPAGQGVHADVRPPPSGAYVPGWHKPEQADDVEPPVPYLPAGQGVHAEDVAPPTE